ncbi:glycosyltransferase group 2 family protein [Clostridium sp. CAG:813]|nr:glycosyltransferase group 2 family protein [Clostridium sp. CAG:813]
MKISLNCRTVSNEVQNIEISTEVIKGSLEIDFLQHEDGMCYHLLKKNGTLYEQVSITFDSQLKIDFLDVGQNIFILRSYLDGNLIWESNSFIVNNSTLELSYHFDANSVQLYWNKVIGADGYMLYAKSQDDIFTSIKEVQTNEAVLYGLNGSEELKVKPFKKENGKRVYEFGFATCKLGQKSYLEKLRLFSAIKKSSLSLYWENIANADSYKIYRLTNGKYVLQDVVRECYFTENYLPVGFSYFKVEACIGEEVITSSQTIVCNIKEVEMFAVNVNYKVVLYWNKAPGVAGYRIFKRTQDGNFTGFVSTTEAKYTVENVVPGEFCEFKVKPFIIENGNRLYGDLEAKCAVQTYKTPKIDLVVNEAYGGEVAVSWIFNGDVDGYVLLKNGVECLDIDDGLAHIAMVKYSAEKFKIRGYKNVFGAKVFTCESDEASVADENNRANMEKPNDYKLSVVIPAYNAQKFISRCISSALASDLKEIEVIAVDDGSTDETKDILSWYENMYPQFFKKIFKENGGAAEARNYGIAESKGHYIAFIDSDDMIRPDAYSTMYDSLQKTGADIAIGRLYKVDNDKYYVRHTLPLPAYKAINPEEYLRLLFTQTYNNVAVWNKMYRTKLVQEHPIPLLSYEDVSWTPYILSWADSLCYVDKVCVEWDRKIRSFTLSNELSSRSVELKYQDRLKAVDFFYENGNPQHKEVLAYLKAKRLYNQGETAGYNGYFVSITNMSDLLRENRFLQADEEYSNKLRPYVLDV